MALRPRLELRYEITLIFDVFRRADYRLLVLQLQFLKRMQHFPAQTFRKIQLELTVEVFFPYKTCLNAMT